jgi:hypothetical protein
VFRRSSRLLDALETGEAVVMPASQLGTRSVSVPVTMLPGNRPGACGA